MSNTDYCRECRRETVVVVDMAAGDVICTDCGLVLRASFIDDKAEWREFADNDRNHDPNRVGAPTNPFLADVAPSITIRPDPGYRPGGGGDGDGGGGVWKNRRVMMSKDPYVAAIESAFKSIREIGDRLSLVATIQDRACDIYKKLHDQKSTKGKKLESIAAACVFIACREEGKSRTIKEIYSNVDGSTKREFTRAVDFIKKILNLEMGAKSEDYLRRFCCNLGMSHQEIKSVRETINKSKELDIRRSPTTIAAAVIFMINQLSGSKRSLRDIANATTVGEGAIKNAYKNLQPFAQRILPECFFKGINIKN